MIKATSHCMAWAHHSESNTLQLYKCIEIVYKASALKNKT